METPGRPSKLLVLICICANVLIKLGLSPELDVHFWVYGKHLDNQAPMTPPCFLPASAIRCQLARGTCRVTDRPVWMTTSLDRHGVSVAPADDEL